MDLEEGLIEVEKANIIKVNIEQIFTAFTNRQLPALMPLNYLTPLS